MPIIFPACVVLLPSGSIVPASMAFMSVLPITHATIPNGKQTTKPKIPNTKIIVPRCGCIANPPVTEILSAKTPIVDDKK